MDYAVDYTVFFGVISSGVTLSAGLFRVESFCSKSFGPKANFLSLSSAICPKISQIFVMTRTKTGDNKSLIVRRHYIDI